MPPVRQAFPIHSGAWIRARAGVVVVRHVPALVCESCGQSWIEDEAAANLQRIVQTTHKEKTQVEVAPSA